MPIYPAVIASGWYPIDHQSGPWYIGADESRYVFLQDSTFQQVTCFKSLDDGDTWTAMDVANGPTFDEAANGRGLIGQVSAVNARHLWVLVDEVGYSALPSITVRAWKFDTVTDEWDLAAITGGAFTALETDPGNHFFALSFAVRSDSVIEISALINDGMRRLPIAMKADIGDAAWGAYSAFPGIAATGLSVPDGRYCFAVRGDKTTVVLQLLGAYDVADSCYVSSMTDPVYTSINDLRVFTLDNGTVSGKLDGCLVKAEEGTFDFDQEIVRRLFVCVVGSDLWAAYGRDHNSLVPDYDVKITGPESGPLDYVTSEIFTAGASVEFAYMVDILGNPGLLIVEGAAPFTHYWTQYDGAAWSAPVAAIDLLPSLPDSSYFGISMRHTTLGRVGFVIGDSYWEFKLVVSEVEITDSIETEESVSTPAFLMSTGARSNWYIF